MVRQQILGGSNGSAIPENAISWSRPDGMGTTTLAVPGLKTDIRHPVGRRILKPTRGSRRVSDEQQVIAVRPGACRLELLDGADWPGPRPRVGIGQFNEEEHGAVNPAESVLVLTTAPMDSQRDWASLGCDAHDERFVITVEVVTSKPRPYRPSGRWNASKDSRAPSRATVRGSSGARVDGQVTPQHELVADLMTWWHP